MRKLLAVLVTSGLVAAASLTGIAYGAEDVQLSEFTFDEDALCELRDGWVAEALARHPEGHWVEMKMELDDADLDLLGLPPSDVLRAQRYPNPTLVTEQGETYDVPLAQLESSVDASSGAQTLVTFAGTGCFGIRPGALLLIIDGGSISLCSLAHAYGSAGAYDISTAGHCGGNGSTATVIAGLGNRADATGVVLLDFGRFSRSVDNGLGNDYALIDIDPAFQSLVTPTMCFWGGPRGTYAAEGAVVGVSVGGQGPSVSVDPNPFLAQSIVHYGHGAGVGAGGTPRAGEAIAWGSDHFMFFGAIAPGDSGSGANTVLGDAVGANMQAAGIITHIWIDALMRDGVGIMGGTRATKVGTVANGQIVPYPIPIAGLP